MTLLFKTRIDTGQNAAVLVGGDSLCTFEIYGFPYQIALKLAAYRPQATVVFRVRNSPGTTFYDVIVQVGTTSQVIYVIRDGIPGSTTYRADDRWTWVGAQSIHALVVCLGVNDAVNFGLSSVYTPANYCLNLRAIGLYARETHNCDVVLSTPCWSDQVASPRIEIAGAAWLSRKVAKEQGFLLADQRKVFEAHYTGTGNAGQYDWFADPSDPTHFGSLAHKAVATEIFTTLGFLNE